MSQISKKRVVLGAAALAGGVVTTQTAQADVLSEAQYRASNMTSGGEVVSSSSQARDEDVRRLNQLVENLVNNSNGVVRTTDTIQGVSAGDVADVEADLVQLQALVAQYNTLKTEIDAQVANNQALTGMAPATVTTIEISTNDRDAAIRRLQESINAMTELSRSNADIIMSNARNKAQGDQNLMRDVTNANAIVARAAETAELSEAGAVGNMNDVRDKAVDSSRPGVVVSNKKATDENGYPTDQVVTTQKTGVIVDTTKTQQANTVTTNKGWDGTYVTVTSTSQVNGELEKILDSIRRQSRDASANVAVSSDGYADRSLENVDDINAWLQKEQDRADKVGDDIIANSTSVADMKKYKTEYLAKLQELRAYVQTMQKSDSVKKKFTEDIDAAIKDLEDSIIKLNITDTITEGQNVDFGNIGRPKSEIDAIQADKTSKIDQKVDVAMQKLIASNKQIKTKLDGEIADNSKKIDDYIDKLKNNKGGSQIEESFLQAQPIWNGVNKEGQRYQDFIKQVLADGEAEIPEDYLTKVHDSTGATVKTVGINTSVVKASVAEYNEGAKTGRDNAAGFVMLKSAVASDVIKPKLTGKPGEKWLWSGDVSGYAKQFSNSTSYPINPSNPGAGMFDYTIPQGQVNSGIKGFYAQMEDLFQGNMKFVNPMGDIARQYINDATLNGQTYKHENVVALASFSPIMTFTLDDAFVYKDSEGNTKTADVDLTVTIEGDNGQNLGDEAAKEGALYTLYFYYFGIDPSNGKLSVGTGYTSMVNVTNGTGPTSYSWTGGGGEWMAPPPDPDFWEWGEYGGNLTAAGQDWVNNWRKRQQGGGNTGGSTPNTGGGGGGGGDTTGGGGGGYVDDTDYSYGSGITNIVYIPPATHALPQSAAQTWALIAQGGGLYPNVMPTVNMGMGLRNSFKIRVDAAQAGTGQAVIDLLEAAENAGVYVADIDDGQVLEVPSAGYTIISAGGYTNHELDSIRQPDGTSSKIVRMRNGNASSSPTALADVAMNDQSLVLFNNKIVDDPAATGAQKSQNALSGTGLSHTAFAIAKRGTPGQVAYQSIDTVLFAPTGVIGIPRLDVDPLTHTLDTFNIADPSAIAHSDWNGNVTVRHPYLKADVGEEPRPVNGYNASITTPTFSAEDLRKIVSHGNSIVVRENPSKTKRTSSDNTLVVRTITKSARTSSGNTMTIRTIAKKTTTASGNTLVVKTLVPKSTATASGNSLTVTISNPKP